MKHPRRDTIPIHAEAGPGAPRRSFTLTELLVAIGVVALLSVAIGQIFQTIGRIVSTGSAIAEVDQVARAIERQLRDDFASLNRMNPDETFIAIRMREIGDVNRSGSADENLLEVPIYMTQDDREADRRDNLTPYQTTPTQSSRAVTRRIDEIIFLAASPPGGVFTSHQLDHDKSRGGPNTRIIPSVSTQAARIYYGHALLPALDPEPDLPPGSPRRQYYPDGHAELQIADREWGAAFGAENTRNEFASDWMLARQPLLLFGGNAAGHGSSFRTVAPIGNGREFAPFIRDTESIARFNQANLGQQSLGDLWTNANPPTEDDITSRLFLEEDPEERLIAWGRVDIAAQNFEDVRRWLEGEPPGWMPGRIPSAVPFDTGQFRNPELFDLGEDFDLINAPLWTRVDRLTPTNMGGFPGASQAQSQLRLQRNLAGLFSAVAGVFSRPLQESTPPVIERAPGRADVANPHSSEFQPSDALMDTHALLSARCSNFEIAWSDGSIALRDIRIGGRTVVNAGDLLWFDISPVDPEADTIGPNNVSDQARSTYEWWATSNLIRPGDVDLRAYAPNFDLPLNQTSYRNFPRDFPEISPRRLITMQLKPLRIVDRIEAVSTAGSPQPPPFYTGVAPYNTAVTGGAPGAPFHSGRAEYLAIWPFREIDHNGNYAGPWRKNLHIRIRMTLHDAQGRLPEGRTYEYIFRVNPGLGT